MQKLDNIYLSNFMIVINCTLTIFALIGFKKTKIPSKLEVAPPYAKCGVGDG